MKLENNDFNKCYICGAKEVATNSSLHVWNIKYNCGCEVFGVIGNNSDIDVFSHCPYDLTTKPLYEHDCSECCIFLGNDGVNDYYFHRDPEDAFMCSLICRYSSSGPDYSSGISFCMSSKGINKALELAYIQKVLTPNEIKYIKQKQEQWFNYCLRDVSYAEAEAKDWEGFTRFVLP